MMLAIEGIDKAPVFPLSGKLLKKSFCLSGVLKSYQTNRF